MEKLIKRRTYINRDQLIGVRVLDRRGPCEWTVTNGKEKFVMECARKTPHQIGMINKIRKGRTMNIRIYNVLSHTTRGGKIEPMNFKRAEVAISTVDESTLIGNDQNIYWEKISDVPYTPWKTGNDKFLTEKGK